MLIFYTYIGMDCSDKGKPIVRWGRKAIGSFCKDSLATGYKTDR